MAEGPTYSPRRCLLCNGHFPAEEFGRHTLDAHTNEDRERWPGGIAGFLTYLVASIDQSLIEAEGWPLELTRLHRSRAFISALLADYNEQCAQPRATPP